MEEVKKDLSENRVHIAHNIIVYMPIPSEGPGKTCKSITASTEANLILQTRM